MRVSRRKTAWLGLQQKLTRHRRERYAYSGRGHSRYKGCVRCSVSHWEVPSVLASSEGQGQTKGGEIESSQHRLLHWGVNGGFQVWGTGQIPIVEKPLCQPRGIWTSPERSLQRKMFGDCFGLNVCVPPQFIC